MKQIKQLRKKLRITRHRRDQTAEEVAEQLPIAKSTIHNFEAGISGPGTKTIISICDYLDLDPTPYLEAIDGGSGRSADQQVGTHMMSVTEEQYDLIKKTRDEHNLGSMHEALGLLLNK